MKFTMHGRSLLYHQPGRGEGRNGEKKESEEAEKKEGERRRKKERKRSAGQGRKEREREKGGREKGMIFPPVTEVEQLWSSGQ